MTIEQFDKTAFTKGMKLKHKDVATIYDLVFIDFTEQLFGLHDCILGIWWVRCENVELIP